MALLEMQGQINLSRLLEFTVVVRQRLKVLTTSNLSQIRSVSGNSSPFGNIPRMFCSSSPRRDLGRTRELILRNKRAHISQKAKL